MKKYLSLFLFALLGLAAQAQTAPSITLTVGVDGNERTLIFAATEAGHKFQIDWGDGNLVETEEIVVNTDGWTWTEVKGTPVGEGNIKIYGEGIDYFDCSSRVDGAQVSALDVTNAPDLTELTINTNSLTQLDLSKNTKLTDLICSTNPLKQLDLKANTALETLEANDLQLESIDLTANTALTSLKLNNSKLTQIDLSKNTELTQIYILGNLLTQIDLSNNDKLTYVSLNNNQLTSLDVTGCEALKSLFCMGNQLTELKADNVITSVNCSKNNFTLATLPALPCKTFTYAPQNDMPIVETIKVGETVDLSAQDNITGLADAAQKTTYTWITTDGNTLEAGTDYTEEEGGRFTFLKAQSAPVYCVMTTDAFPKFTGANAFKTTSATITDGTTVSTPAITLTVEVDGNERALIFAATEAGHKFQIDWGDGNLVETEEILVNTDGWTWTEVKGTPVGEGNIKIYGEGIDYFDCSSRVDGAQVSALDVTNAPDLTELTINTNSLTQLDLSKNTKLTDLICSTNPLKQLDLKANTALETLEANDLQLESIDLTANTALTSLKLNNSKLTQIDLSKNTELTQIYILGNLLTQIDLSNNDKLTYASLNNNQLTTVDVTGCDALKSLLCMGNQITELKVNDLTGTVNVSQNLLTPATLPVVSGRYTYAPQAAMPIAKSAKVGETIDLSAQDNLTGLADAPQATTYAWITLKGDTLEAGTDYTADGGRFTFLKAQADSVYCSMTTAAFPAFEGDKAFKTTAIAIAEGATVDTPAITLTVTPDGNTRNLVFAMTEAGHTLQIDWGDGNLVETEEIVQLDEYGTNTTATGVPAGEGIIKVYGEGIAYFDCSPAQNEAKVTAIDVTGAKDLLELNVYSNALSTLDLSQNAALKKLGCYNNDIAELDLSANTALERLDAKNMALDGIDLSANTALTYLALSNNPITSIDLSANTALTDLYLQNGQLSDIDLTGNTALEYISLTGNQLTQIDVTACEALDFFFCNNNQLEEVKFGNVTRTVNISGNRLTPADLPAATATNYIYAPQAAMQLDEEIETGKTLDLSAQDNLTGLADGPQATTYTWYAEDGTTLVAGTDYTEDGGKFTFLKAQSQPVYCTMETAAFPSFSGANAFRTTAISVKGGDGVESTATATIAIRGGKGTITTDNLPAGSRVEVYDLSGRKVAGQDSAEGRATFSVKPGLYIVSVNGTARKVNAF